MADVNEVMADFGTIHPILPGKGQAVHPPLNGSPQLSNATSCGLMG